MAAGPGGDATPPRSPLLLVELQWRWPSGAWRALPDTLRRPASDVGPPWSRGGSGAPAPAPEERDAPPPGCVWRDAWTPGCLVEDIADAADAEGFSYASGVAACSDPALRRRAPDPAWRHPVRLRAWRRHFERRGAPAAGLPPSPPAATLAQQQQQEKEVEEVELPAPRLPRPSGERAAHAALHPPPSVRVRGEREAASLEAVAGDLAAASGDLARLRDAVALVGGQRDSAALRARIGAAFAAGRGALPSLNACVRYNARAAVDGGERLAWARLAASVLALQRAFESQAAAYDSRLLVAPHPRGNSADAVDAPRAPPARTAADAASAATSAAAAAAVAEAEREGAPPFGTQQLLLQRRRRTLRRAPEAYEKQSAHQAALLASRSATIGALLSEAREVSGLFRDIRDLAAAQGLGVDNVEDAVEGVAAAASGAAADLGAAEGGAGDRCSVA